MPTDQNNPSPASDNNRARQNLSRRNITHPIRWTDENIEKSSNQRRKIAKKDQKTEIRKLH